MSREMEEQFQCKYIYVTLFTQLGANNLGISCSFPNEALKEKDKGTIEVQQISNKDLRSKFMTQIDSQIEELDGNWNA